MLVRVAATQMACSWDIQDNLDQAESLVRDAAGQGANIVLLQELFETPYFPTDMNDARFELATPLPENLAVKRMSALCRELGVVVPVSFFERDGGAYYNSLVVIDTDGTCGELYRKSHIPEGPGYEEKHFFKPGDTGFKVWPTKIGNVGAAICWDQWFPECARSMVLAGADILFYPTAIGNEPQDPAYDSRDHWQRVMQGHAAANMVPVVASNRVGVEVNKSATMTFYGSSFIANQFGAKVAEAPREGRTVITAEFDLEDLARQRKGWGLFRDRRPDLYGRLTERPSSV